MTLLKVLDDGADAGRTIVWSYYLDRGLMAYCVGTNGKTHAQIDMEVSEKCGDKDKEIIIAGEIVPPPMSRIGIHIDQRKLSEECKSRLITGVTDIMKYEQIDIKDYDEVTFLYNRTLSLNEFLSR